MISLLLFVTLNGYSQGMTEFTGSGITEPGQPLNIGIVISTTDAETVWNALRLANYALEESDTVSIFLLGKGVEIFSISDKKFDVQVLLDDFAGNGGKIQACGTCMRSRNMEESNVCPVSSLSDLYDLIRKSDRILTF
jgi:uncharacterized protein involved in oxidation of intracellular sulfur